MRAVAERHEHLSSPEVARTNTAASALAKAASQAIEYWQEFDAKAAMSALVADHVGGNDQLMAPARAWRWIAAPMTPTNTRNGRAGTHAAAPGRGWGQAMKLDASAHGSISKTCRAIRAPTKISRDREDGGASSQTQAKDASAELASRIETLAGPLERPTTTFPPASAPAPRASPRAGDLPRTLPGVRPVVPAESPRGRRRWRALFWFADRECWEEAEARTARAATNEVEIAPRNPTPQKDRRSQRERPGAPACSRMHKGTTSTSSVCDQNQPLGSSTTSSYARMNVLPAGSCCQLGVSHDMRRAAVGAHAVCATCWPGHPRRSNSSLRNRKIRSQQILSDTVIGTAMAHITSRPCRIKHASEPHVQAHLRVCAQCDEYLRQRTLFPVWLQSMSSRSRGAGEREPQRPEVCAGRHRWDGRSRAPPERRCLKVDYTSTIEESQLTRQILPCIATFGRGSLRPRSNTAWLP